MMQLKTRETPKGQGTPALDRFMAEWKQQLADSLRADDDGMPTSDYEQAAKDNFERGLIAIATNR